MKKIKYYYNTHTLRYEKLVTPLRVKLLRFFGFMATALVTSAIISYFAFQFIGSPGEKLLRAENERLGNRYQDLRRQLDDLQQQMAELEKRDNNVYRSIFEAEPIPDSARARALEKLNADAAVARLGDNQLVSSIQKDLDTLGNRIKAQEKSFVQLSSLINNKEKLLAATPAIQPVSNKDLDRIASGFGYRIDPIYKTIKMHAGLDFTAPQGTPIYATAEGSVRVAGYSDGGYGNHVIVNHGYGYQTLYGHMVRIKARAGQRVKRGELIGYVGSTGKSTGPHLHYEVHKNGNKLDPVYFFYNDLGPEQFNELLKRAKASNQSFD
ncbi:Murein DD-endopeptidase MepM and murein hydrolase activator NlpD, contain LysM domain [Cnuella takakiae]|uniref:Murein DD-endopeptidase MepM and murein hydrolase activator NlpD, contain LysM domain n=1 Tax=Cnuella takakiae TaxID=1302690 RepID=A0A1M5EVE3_9BACT|nr:M23 family metallopeptidase [Cnuella takakiae]OLY91309.1 peptidase M23 [Cnuella takakiae]SHF83002.1 Murein DD-endopeptidase MepM and murein hydrolase activator NlpD, contain LysM domain [Cnuella takakiae]